MTAYVILEVEVKDIAEYLLHQQQLAPLLEAAGARYLARGGQSKALGVEDEPGRLMLIEFPSLEAIEALYNGEGYRQLMPQRDACSSTRILAVQGLQDDPHRPASITKLSGRR